MNGERSIQCTLRVVTRPRRETWTGVLILVIVLIMVRLGGAAEAAPLGLGCWLSLAAVPRLLRAIGAGQ